MLNLATIHFGKVIHHRFSPDNQFDYPVFYLRIPMRSRRIDSHLLRSKGIGDNQFSWISFYDKDHGDGKLVSLDWIEDVLKNANRQDIDGEIWLHTFPRVLGYVFNPVSFWYCHNANGELKAVVAEVNNTFGERYSYFLESVDHTSIPWGHQIRSEKIFHVSPFFDVVGHYLFRFMQQPTSLEHPRYVSRIDYYQKDVRTLMTSVSGTAYPLNHFTKWRAILSFPFLTIGVIFKIHWQALQLFIKGAKFYKKPSPPINTNN